MLASLFGHGDDDHPVWLLAVRVNILLLLGACVVAVVLTLARAKRAGLVPPGPRLRIELVALAVLTAVAFALRFDAARNLFDMGGIPYSRLLVGYRGNFATAQAYALVDGLTRRDLDHALVLQRVFGAATVPLVFVVARALGAPSRAGRDASIAFPSFAAGLLACSPLHVLFSASDALSVFTGFLCALSYACVVQERRTWVVAGLLGLALLTQVRYENSLLVVPAVVWLAARRRWAAAALASVAGAAYLPTSLAAGISYQDRARFADSVHWLATDHFLFAPFLGLPLLLAGALLVGLSRRPWLVVAALSPFAAVAVLAAGTSEHPHDAARVLSNALVPISLAAGYGFSLLASAGDLGRVAAAVVALHVATRPLAMREPLHARYLEMAENDAFESLLRDAPTDVEGVVVPDDEAMRRAEHATVETMTKYRSVRHAIAGNAPRLVGLTRFLELPSGTCPPDRCVFFRGLPCLVEGVDRHVGAQCRALGERETLTPIASAHVTAAPYLACSIASGALRRRECDPTVRPLDFTLERIR